MSISLSDEIKQAIQDKDTIKVLATTDRNGVPHVVFKGSLHIDENGDIVFYEILESSQTNRNMVAGIWFHQTVAVNILTKEKKSYQIKGSIKKAVTAGRKFEKVYQSIREKLGDVDLSTIWTIEPKEWKEETFQTRVEEDEAVYPLLKHLDRVAKE